jgi:DNA polymerase-3 subunit beta
MKFAVTRSSLLSELNMVQGVIEKKGTTSILSNILVEATGDHLDITATDGDVTIRCGCAVAVAVEGTTTIGARRLFDIVRLLPENAEIEISLMENNWVELRSGNSHYKIVAIPKDDFPVIPDASPTIATVPGGVLEGMIQRTMFAITQEDSRYSLNGALLVLQPGAVNMVATDGHRLALVGRNMEIPDMEEEVRVLVPRKALTELLKFLGGQDIMIEFGRSDNHLFFTAGNKRIVSSILAGHFPNYELVIPRDNDKLVIIGTKVFGDGIRRAAVMSDERLKSIKLSFSTGELEISAVNTDAGESREVVPIEFEGERLDIGFNSQYLLDFIGACDADSVSISIKDSDTQGLFRPVGADDLEYRYVAMPMNV